MIVLLHGEHAAAFLAQLLLRCSDMVKPDLQAKLDELKTELGKDTDVKRSAHTALDGQAAALAEALKNALPADTDPAVLAALDEAIATVKASTADLAAAVVADTPQA